MFEVEITAGFAAAHLLREYKGKCEHLHGHNYKICVAVRASSPGAGGMVIDFSDLKKATNGVIDRLDHTFLNEIKPFDTIEPSAENIAHYLFHEIADKMGDRAQMLYRVSVWESDTSKASFIRDTP